MMIPPRMLSAAVLLVLGLPAGAQTLPADPISHIADGIQYVDGKPFVKTAAWWGVNHWMASDPDRGLGNLLALPADKVGTDADFYGRAGFDTGFYAIVGNADKTGKNILLLREAIARAKKNGQKIAIHVNCFLPEDIVKARGWTKVTEEGETKPLGNEFFPDAKEHAAAMRDLFKPYADAIRDEPTVIGYQIGGETWAAISYDTNSILRFRDFLKQQFTLEALSQRYFGKGDAYTAWDQVFPPVKGGAADFNKRPLVNGGVAWFDWARYNKKVHEDVWVEMLKVFNELDGRGRPISYEYNMGPKQGRGYGLYNFNFPGICDRSTNFSVGPGEFTYTLADSMMGLYTKTCGKGPWFSNEVDARPAMPRCGYPAYYRRHVWWTLALGGNGYNLWTFYNLLGADNEFLTERCYDPIRAENLPSGFFEIEHCNRMIDSLGGLLAGSVSPSPSIGIFYLDDSSLTEGIDFTIDSYGVMRALASHGLADQVAIFTEYHLDTMDLRKLKVIILPRTPRITAEHQKKLADYVASGGTLILMAPTGKKDDLCRESAHFPTGDLAKATGIQFTELSGPALHAAPLSLPWKGKSISLDVQAQAVPGGVTAQPLVMNGKDPAVTVNSFGKGRCYYLAGRPLVVSDDDPTGDFLASLVLDAGVVPAATLREGGQLDTGVYAGRRTGPQGTLLLLVENAGRPHNLVVKLDPVALGLTSGASYAVHECFGGGSAEISALTGWSFPAHLEPVGVRAYFITREKNLANLISPDKQVVIPRDDPDTVLVAAPSKESSPYRAGDAAAGELERNKIEIQDAAEILSGPPRDLGNGYVGLDLDGACNRPLRSLLQNLDESSAFQFGGATSKQEAGDKVPIQPGRNLLGTVPVWGNGRFVEMGKRIIRGLRVGSRVVSLHFFHHGVYWVCDSVLGYYTVHYADGTTERIPIVIGSTLSDLQRPWGVSPKTDIIWTAANGNRLSRFDWINPHPEKVVDSVDITRNDKFNISVWGMTAKKFGYP